MLYYFDITCSIINPFLRILGKNFDKGFFEGIRNKDIKELVNSVPLSSPCLALPLAMCLSTCHVLRILPLACFG